MKAAVALTGLFLLLTSYTPADNDIPVYSHIIIVMEENHAFHQVIGSPNAPYINELAKNGVLFTDSHGVGHPSQPNYLALFSGSMQGVTGDGCLIGRQFKTPNLGAALIAKKLSFTGYAQTMPKEGFLGCTYRFHNLTVGNLYARKHAPWVNWIGTGENSIPAKYSQPMTVFPKSFDKLPTVSFVVPDMDHDMHNIGLPGDAAAIRRGDKWLKENLRDYAEWAKSNNSLLIVTFDEDNYDTKNDNKIATIFYGDKLKKGEYNEHITHYVILHTIEAMYGLPSDDKVSAAPITDVWKKGPVIKL
ncbi:MAG: acid phosphatase [Bacteroidetes bacterium]|nr:acid phosphatase [Bacteroidota bacterium]